MIEPVVADASPIISFARAGKLPLLQQVFPRVLLAPEVFKEVALEEPDRPGACDIRKGIWGELCPEIDLTIVQGLPRSLHKGEREAVALALQLKRSLLVDEKRVIRVARAAGIMVVTSLRVLITAKQLGLIPVIGPTLDEMRSNQFRISDQLYHEALRLAGE